MARTIGSSGHLALCGELIKARMGLGLTQAQLADRLGCQQSLIARIESGQRRVDAVELVILARALEMELQNIFKVLSDSIPPDALLKVDYFGRSREATVRSNIGDGTSHRTKQHNKKADT